MLDQTIWTIGHHVGSGAAGRVLFLQGLARVKLTWHGVFDAFTGQTFALALSSGTSSTSKASSPYLQSLAPYHSDLKICVGSYIDTAASNNITVLGLNPQLVQGYEGFSASYHREDSSSLGNEFVPIARADTPYPATKVGFSPSTLAGRLQNTSSSYETREMIASTSDSLRLWDLAGPAETQGSSYVGRTGQAKHTLVERSALINVSYYNNTLVCIC